MNEIKIPTDLINNFAARAMLGSTVSAVINNPVIKVSKGLSVSDISTVVIRNDVIYKMDMDFEDKFVLTNSLVRFLNNIKEKEIVLSLDENRITAVAGRETYSEERMETKEEEEPRGLLVDDEKHILSFKDASKFDIVLSVDFNKDELHVPMKVDMISFVPEKDSLSIQVTSDDPKLIRYKKVLQAGIELIDLEKFGEQLNVSQAFIEQVEKVFEGNVIMRVIKFKEQGARFLHFTNKTDTGIVQSVVIGEAIA